jgi:hypothetical protein
MFALVGADTRASLIVLGSVLRLLSQPIKYHSELLHSLSVAISLHHAIKVKILGSSTSHSIVA